MAHYQNNIAIQFPLENGYIPGSSHFYTAFEQSEDEVRVEGLNQQLKEKSGREFRIEFFCGDQVGFMDEATLTNIAECYKEVFNESWGENWTTQSAKEEIRTCLNSDPDRVPVVSLLYKGDRVIGFCWAFAMSCSDLTVHSAPFSSSTLKRHESVEIANYWMKEVGSKKKFITIRELGVVKEYRQDKAPYLCMPVFNKAQDLGCDVIFFRTKVSSKAFKWSLGVGFVPLQFFMQDGLLLMQGSIKYAVDLLDGLMGKQKRKSQHMIISNINRYLCV